MNNSGENFDGGHAYLIMAHNNFNILEKLLQVLDDKRNDIYVHIDKRTNDVPFVKLKAAVENARLYFIPRISVNWGGDSQIKVALMLLESAIQTRHLYYHFISGVDLPLKTQDEIYCFFSENQGNEYMSFDFETDADYVRERVRYYYLFQNKIGRNSGKIVAGLYYLQRAFLKLQKSVNFDRTRRDKIEIYKGAQWFSITHEFAKYLVLQKKIIHKYFFHAVNADEVFVQTLAMNSEFKNKVVDNDLRYIDWERGKPYTFTIEDFSALMGSERIFARKFDEKADFEIVEKIYSHLKWEELHG